jgi:Ca2+-binding EF-hand superfamily protein
LGHGDGADADVRHGGSDKVAKQAIRKAFNMMDMSKRGRLGWREFKHIIRHLRPGPPPRLPARSRAHVYAH